MSKTKLIGIISFLCLLVAGGVLAWVLYEIYTSGKELDERVALIADKHATSRAFTELSNLLLSTQEDRDELATYLLTEAETSNFLTDIESFGPRLGVALTTLSLTVEEKEGMFDDLMIEFSFKGTEFAVKKMLEVFENLPYHSQVTSLTMTQSVDGNTEATLGLRVSLLNHGQ
jgi:hypothetical protein